jgi:hypothetical protein
LKQKKLLETVKTPLYQNLLKQILFTSLVSLVIFSYDIKASYGAVDPEADQYGASGVTGASDSSGKTGATGASDSSGATGASYSSGATGTTDASDSSGATGSSYGHEESSLMRSPELIGNVQSTRYLKFFTLVVVVAALLGSTMYLTSSIRGKRPSMEEESSSDVSFAGSTSVESVKINLGSCSKFAILAGTTLTFNAALTVVVSGSIGSSGGGAVTGNYQLNNGTTKSVTAETNQCKNDLSVAYNAASTAICDTTLSTVYLTGRTLFPGIYCSGTMVLQSFGKLVLDAEDNPDGVWIL